METANSKQLHFIEEYSPNLKKETGYIWKRLCEKDFKYEKFDEENNNWKIVYCNKEKERNQKLKILCNRLSQSQANKPKAKQIQMATDKLGQRRCSNKLDSAVKNIASTSESKSTSHRSHATPIVSIKSTKAIQVRSCSKGMKAMNKIIKRWNRK